MPRDPRLEPLNALFRDFARRCLIEDGSLLWPGMEVWTIATLEEARRRFVEGYLRGRLAFRAKLEAQLAGAPQPVWALMADCFYLYGLPSATMRPATKQNWVTWAAQQAGLTLPPAGDALWEPLRLGFAPTGQKYNFKHAQLRLLILLGLEVKAAPDRAALLEDPQALQAALDGILESIPLKLDRANDMRSALLYMAFPDRYEPVLSASEKDAILRHYAPQVGEPLPDDRDEALRLVRRALAPRLGQGFAFYGEARPEWAPARLPAGPHPPEWRMMEAPAGREVREPPGDWITRPAGAAPTPADPDLARVLAALRLTRNVILTGPPGSGKTYLAAQAAQALTSGQGERADDFVEWVTLHPSYTYEDFVEGLRPALGPEGGPAYEVRPGVFRHVCERAARDPAHTYVLVLDEINRANLARVLGELVTLIDDEQRGALAVRLPASGERLRVPPNLLLLGTMNSADRSVALLDAALRRRFAFVEIAPRPDLLAGAVIETEEAALHLDALLACLNALILDLSGPEGRDTLIGHSYFLRAARAAPDARLPLLELAWNEQVLPLLEEIFYTRRDRLADALAPFVEDGDPLAPREIARLHGEDLVVALSRVCK